MLKFKTERAGARITRIFAFSTELMYLVEGDDRAALIDTGSGIGRLRACVDGLTDKPLIVLTTHGHIDHAMGSAEFTDVPVYMSRKDDYIYRVHGSDEFRRRGLPGSAPTPEDEFIPTADLSLFRDLKDGDTFDLGGETIEILACPGHTLGSVTMLLRSERILITGDAVNPRTFMFGGYSTGIRTFKKSLETLRAETDGRYDRVFTSHGAGEVPTSLIPEAIALCDRIIARADDRAPFEFMGEKGYMALAVGPDGKQAGVANIVYDPAKIDE